MAEMKDFQCTYDNSAGISGEVTKGLGFTTFPDTYLHRDTMAALHAMCRIPVMQEDTAAVCGLGTIGMLLAMLLKAHGIENLFLIGNKECQQKKARELEIPAERYCDSRNGDAAEWLMRHTDGKGVDVFFECVGSNQTVSQADLL